MVLARLSKWVFKNGKRERGFNELDSTMADQARTTQGFRGVISLLSRDDPNVGIIITLWNDEEALQASEADVFKSSVQKISEYVAEPPIMQNYRLFTAELRALTPS